MSNRNDFEYEEFMRWKEARARQHARVDGPDPQHRGVIDASYVRGMDVKEFPKVAYRQDAKEKMGYRTRVVESADEQATAVKNGWLVQTKDIHALLEGLLKEKNGLAAEAAA
jgi:hypothetical protein